MSNLEDIKPEIIENQEQVLELPKLKRDITVSKKHGTDHLIGECHINFQKLMENILNIN